MMATTRLIHRAIVRIAPAEPAEDVRAFLQGLVTQDTQSALPFYAALLSPQGKMLFDFFLWADGADVLIDCEAEQADALIRQLSMYRLRRKISIVKDDSLGVFWRLDAGDNPDPRLAALGHRWIAALSPDDLPGDDAYRAHRLSLGVTEGAAELGSDQTLWLECNAIELNGVSFDKGCYVGQENTARMNWRSTINRRMVVVPIGEADAKRQRIAYPELGLSVEHRRVEDLRAMTLPDWLNAAIEPVVEDLRFVM